MSELKKLAEIEALAKEGDAEALYVLGGVYLRGLWLFGVRPNTKEAAKCFEEAAEQGHAEAQCILGEMCKHGAITPKDYLKAAERGGWNEKAERFLKLHELFLKLHELEAKQNDWI